MVGTVCRVDYTTIILHLSRLSGTLPVDWMNTIDRRGKSVSSRHFQLSPRAGVFTLAQVLVLAVMVHSQITRGLWRGPDKFVKLNFSVVVLGSEIIRLLTVLLCLFVRFSRNFITCLNQSSNVLKGLKTQSVTFSDSGILFFMVHCGVMIHRIIYTIQNQLNVMLYFITSIQMAMLEILLVYFTSLTAKSFKCVNHDLRRLALDKSKVITPNGLFDLMQRHSTTREFFCNLSNSLGPDVVFMMMHTLFKITLLGYLLYYWYFSGYIGKRADIFVMILEIMHTILPSFWIARNCDAVLKEQKITRIMLLLIIAEKGEILSSHNIADIQVFLTQCRSQVVKFTACDHFTLNRQLLYKLILISATYVVMMIQFHTVL